MSPGREYDRKVRESILETMTVAIKMFDKTRDPYWLEEAKWYGQHSERLKKRIETHDYKEEDEDYRTVANITL